MKINKNYKFAATIENAWRPPPRYKRDYTLCRITHGTLLSIDDAFNVQIDCDNVSNFVQKFTKLPHNEYYMDGIFEMVFSKEEHLPKILTWAKKAFDVCVFEKLDGSIEVIKTHEKTK